MSTKKFLTLIFLLDGCEYEEASSHLSKVVATFNKDYSKSNAFAQLSYRFDDYSPYVIFELLYEVTTSGCLLHCLNYHLSKYFKLGENLILTTTIQQ